VILNSKTSTHTPQLITKSRPTPNQHSQIGTRARLNPPQPAYLANRKPYLLTFTPIEEEASKNKKNTATLSNETIRTTRLGCFARTFAANN